MVGRRLLSAALLAMAVLAVALAYGVFVVWGLPSRASVRALARTQPVSSALMRERQSEGGRPPRHGRWQPLRQISPYLLHAVLASEDQRFFEHEGVDWDAVEDSAEADARRGRLYRGGSTLTQQLAKNLFFSTRRSLTRKLRELIVAHWLEQDLPKPRILELYLNLIEWGDGIYGCDAAARRAFGKAPAQLTRDEAAALAAAIPAPRRLDPRSLLARRSRAFRRVLRLVDRSPALADEARRLGALAPAAVQPAPDRAGPSGPGPS